MLQQQVQSLQEEVSLRTSGKHGGGGDNSCSYIEKQVKSLQRVADDKEQETASLNEQLRDIKQSFDQMQTTGCAIDDVAERYSNSRHVTFKGKYAFLVEQMERKRYDDPETMEHLLHGV